MSRLWRTAAARASSRPGRARRGRGRIRADLPRGAHVTDAERNQTQDRQRLHLQVAEPVTPRQAQRDGQFLPSGVGITALEQVGGIRLRRMRASDAGALGPPHRPPRRRTERRPCPTDAAPSCSTNLRRITRSAVLWHRPRFMGIAKGVLGHDLAGFEVRDRRYQCELWIVRYDMAAEAIEHASQRPTIPLTIGQPAASSVLRACSKRGPGRCAPPTTERPERAARAPGSGRACADRRAVGGIGVLSIR